MIEHPILNKLVDLVSKTKSPKLSNIKAILKEYKVGTDYERQSAERDKIVSHFCPGLEYLSWDATMETPINFDFSSDYYDRSGNGRWRVADHPDLQSILDELADEVEVETGRSEATLLALSPEEDGSITLRSNWGGPGTFDTPPVSKENLEFRGNLIKDLESLNIEVDEEDFDLGDEYIVQRGDKSWAQLIELFDIDPDLFEQEDQNGEDRWYPGMNFAYPLPDGVRSTDQWHRAMSNTTVVEIEGEPYLALTGGGMDFSWEICEAYLNCGYWPPAHFAGRLPKMSGRGKSEHDQMIINACRVSLQHMAETAIHQHDQLDELETWSKEHD